MGLGRTVVCVVLGGGAGFWHGAHQQPLEDARSRIKPTITGPALHVADAMRDGATSTRRTPHDRFTTGAIEI